MSVFDAAKGGTLRKLRLRRGEGRGGKKKERERERSTGKREINATVTRANKRFEF